MSDTVIRVAGVSKRFALNREKTLKERLVLAPRRRHEPRDFLALSDVSFELDAGHTLGLIGQNGSGKSTLLAILGGIVAPSEGTVDRRGRLAALLELGAGFHPDLTGRENVHLNASILGLSRRQTAACFDAIVDFSGIAEFIDTQVKFYSSGMYVRLAFSVAVHVDPEILLVDEVLAVGDEPFQRKCLERIKAFQRDGRTIVFVTHSLDVTRQLCDRVIMLDHGRTVVDGPPLLALRTFRESVAEPELAALDATAGELPGSRELEVRSVTAVGADGAPKDTFAPGDDLGLLVDVVAHQPGSPWVCGLAIFNDTENLVYGINTKTLGVPLQPFSGTTRLHFTFPEIPMVEGRYHVSVTVHHPKGSEYHSLERVGRFKVYADADETGTIHLRPRVEQVPATGPLDMLDSCRPAST